MAIHYVIALVAFHERFRDEFTARGVEAFLTEIMCGIQMQRSRRRGAGLLVPAYRALVCLSDSASLGYMKELLYLDHAIDITPLTAQLRLQGQQLAGLSMRNKENIHALFEATR